jgi:hypothetical protein
LFPCNNFHQRFWAVQQGLAELRKAHIAPAGDDVVTHMNNLLLQRFMADLWAAQDDFDVWALRFELLDQGKRLHRVPDVDAESDDVRLFGQQFVSQLLGGTVDGEFAQAGLSLQMTHIRQQIPQPQRGVDVFGVQRAQQNISHASIMLTS